MGVFVGVSEGGAVAVKEELEPNETLELLALQLLGSGLAEAILEETRRKRMKT